MKKMVLSIAILFVMLGLTMSAFADNVGWAGGSRFTLLPIKIGVGFNRQMYVIPSTPEQLTLPGGTTTLRPTAPADVSIRVLAGPFGGEFDIGGNQYAITGIGDVNVFDVGLKAFYAIISKPYVKFNGGIALMYTDVDGKNMGALIGTGFDFIAGPEFFIPQIPELGFNIELGLGYHSYSFSGDHFAGDDLGFRNADFLQAGMHYYF